MLLGERTDLYLGNFVGKCIFGPGYWGKKLDFNSFSKKKKKKAKKNRKQHGISMLHRLLSNVLSVLDGLLHLIEIKICGEIVVSISPCILLEAQALKTLLGRERDAVASHIDLYLVNFVARGFVYLEFGGENLISVL